jgi:hypothetical protein
LLPPTNTTALLIAAAIRCASSASSHCRSKIKGRKIFFHKIPPGSPPF